MQSHQPVERSINFMPACTEIVIQIGRNVGIVFDDQNAHIAYPECESRADSLLPSIGAGSGSVKTSLSSLIIAAATAK